MENKIASRNAPEVHLWLLHAFYFKFKLSISGGDICMNESGTKHFTKNGEETVFWKYENMEI